MINKSHEEQLEKELTQITIEGKARGFGVSKEVLYKTGFTTLVVHAFHIPKSDGVIHHFDIDLIEYKRKKQSEPWIKVKNSIEQFGKDVSSLKIDCGNGKAVKKLTEFLNAQFKAIGQKIETKKVIIDNPEEIDFSKLDKSKFKEIEHLVSAKQLENILSKWKSNQKNGSEEFWQVVFQEDSWILSQIFSCPFIQIGNKFYCGGKEDDDKGGVKGDLLYQNKLTGNIAFIEIKTPNTDIVGPKYRGEDEGKENVVYSMSNDLTGGLTQVLNQRKVYLSTYGDKDGKFLHNGRCILIIGNIESLEDDEKKSFELHRSLSREVEVITYDELFGRVQSFLDILKN